MSSLFLFGTLRYKPLLEAVLGSSDHLQFQSGSLPDHAIGCIAEAPFPTIAAKPDERAEGLLITGLTASDFERLDFYEGAFGYRLAPVSLEHGQTSQAYFPPTQQAEPSAPWSFDAWSDDWADLSVLAAQEVMTYIGQKTATEVGCMFPMIRARAWSRLNAAKSRHGALTYQGTVDVVDHRRPYANYFALDEYDLHHPRFDGTTTPQVTRAVFLAPDAALVLPYDPLRDRVLLVEQMRMGPLARGDRALWQLEPIAGRLDPGETPETAVRREAMEEAGLTLGALEPVAETYCSPGNSSEFYYIYVGLTDLPDNSAGLGGLESEDEDIRSHLLSFDDLMAMCGTLQIANAPLVMAAYWLAYHRERLRSTVR